MGAFLFTLSTPPIVVARPRSLEHSASNPPAVALSQRGRSLGEWGGRSAIPPRSSYGTSCGIKTLPDGKWMQDVVELEHFSVVESANSGSPLQ